MESDRTIFFAYEGGHQDNRDAIRAGISTFNHYQKTTRAQSWEDLKIAGNVLNAVIMQAIDSCDVFAADLTYLNHNVLFELGYAIGKEKPLLVFLNRAIEGASDRYESSQLLRGIGYESFATGEDISRALQQHRVQENTEVSSLVRRRMFELDSAELLHLESPIKNQASFDLRQYLSKTAGPHLVNDTTEIEYQTLSWYVSSIVQARAVLIHLVGHEAVNVQELNAEYSFYCGLAAGLGKVVALLAPVPFDAPVDYNDILIQYESSRDCCRKVEAWYTRYVHNAGSQATDTSLATSKGEEDKKVDLLKLGIGYDVAEEEGSNLLEYFVEIDTYRQALNREMSVITGRKGAGKSAIFIKLCDDLADADHEKYAVVLKPESDELLEDVELSRLYQSPASKQAFLSSIWRYVVFARLLEEVARRLVAQPKGTISPGSVEQEIVSYIESTTRSTSDGHFTFLRRLYQELDQHGGFGNQKALNQLYDKYIGPVKALLRRYLSGQRFVEIHVVADNLDKTWDAQHDLDLQADLILALLSFNNRINTELQNDYLKPRTVVFLRKDIFEYVLNRAREPDKLVAREQEINWHRFPQRLKELLEARFRFALQRDKDEPVDDVWRDYFHLSSRRHPYEAIARAVVPRPRDFIYFTSRLFESAVNRDSPHVSGEDFDYASEAYSNYLYRNMIAETRGRFPEITAVLANVQQRNHEGNLEYRELHRALKAQDLDERRIDDLLGFLYDNNYVYAFSEKSGKVLVSFEELQRVRKTRSFPFLRRRRIRIQLMASRQRALKDGYRP